MERIRKLFYGKATVRIKTEKDDDHLFQPKLTGTLLKKAIY